MSNYRSFDNMKRIAAHNIRQGKGFECPTCNSFVRAGEDVCYNCGDMPAIGSSSGHTTSYRPSPKDGYAPLVFLSPLFYYLGDFFENPGLNALNFLIFIPTIIVAISSMKSLVAKRNKQRRKKFRFVFIRLWVLIFSVLTLINSIKYFNYHW